MDVEHLALAQEFAPDRRGDLLLLLAPTYVRTGWRSSGGVASVDISRMPVTAISSVRGIGVALMASTSTLVRNVFSASLCSTPNRCSSSTITRRGP